LLVDQGKLRRAPAFRPAATDDFCHESLKWLLTLQDLQHAENMHGYAVTVFVSDILWNYDVPFVYPSAKSNVRGHQPCRRTTLKLIL